MRKITIFILLAFLLVFCATPAYAVPALPHAFYGSVSINGNAAPDGTRVSATVDNGTVIPTQNPVTTAADSYGITSLKLLVQGDITPGATITFYVDGVEAVGQTDTFEAGGGPTERGLSVTIVAPAGGGGGGGLPRYYIDTNFFGVEEEYRTSLSGELRETIEATSEDGNLTITVEEDTIALDKDGNRLRTLETTIDENPPDPPEDAHIIGLTYDFGPEGATFNPAITLEFTYDPDDIPEGVAEEDLVLAFYDEDADEWVELTCVVDPETNTITAYVDHFTTFTILGYTVVVPPAPPAPTPAPAPAPAPAPPAPAPAPTPPAPAPPAPAPTPEVVPVNWPVIGGVIGGVIVVGLLIFFLVRRRRRAH